MAYDRLTDDEIEAGEFILASSAKKVQGNQDFFAGQIGTLAAIQLSNGSFEIASDAAQPNLPDNWELTRFANGVFVLDTTLPRHGGKIAKFTHPGGDGNGGGQLISDYFETTPDKWHVLATSFWTTNAGVRITISIEYFDAAQVSISSENLYNAASGHPTSPERQIFVLTIPSNARYLKVTLVGGGVDTDPGVSTDIYFDDVEILVHPVPFYIEGSKQIASDAAGSTTSGSYVQVGNSIECARPGRLTVDFDLKALTGPNTVFGKIYVNGAPIGAERSTPSFTFVTFSEIIDNLKPGDLIQLFLKSGDGILQADAQAFILKSNFYEIATVV